MADVDRQNGSKCCEVANRMAADEGRILQGGRTIADVTQWRLVLWPTEITGGADPYHVRGFPTRRQHASLHNADEFPQPGDAGRHDT